MNYYNDNDAYAAQWLRNLVSAGSLSAGHIDSRSIADIEPEDLRGYDSCHFFAGIGGWPYALELAGWPADRPVWTGSCPCQPFSAAGKQGGSADERHLWPLWLRLIRVCRPDTILGEQVAGAVGFGWLDRVCADLEALGYACGAAVLGAHSVGAPHIRQRLFWVAQSDGAGRQSAGPERPYPATGERGATGRLADAEHARMGPRQSAGNSGSGGMGDADSQRLQGRANGSLEPQGWDAAPRPPRLSSSWSDSIWLPCLDGKARRTQPGIHPLAHGIPNRVGQLRAYGNAIVPQAAAEFIRAVMDIG